MSKSIMQDNKMCFHCGTHQNLHEHHIFFGANRKLSEKHGLKIFLCANHHNMTNDSPHYNIEIDTYYKRLAQMQFEKTHTRKEFMSIFGRNYLD